MLNELDNVFRDVLRVEGVYAKGFGNISKMVMQDKKLTVEAKAIYAYFSSYAGAGSSAFPGVDKIMEDLVLGEERYYSHFAYLKAYGYIKVSPRKDPKGKFKSNVYTLVMNPVPDEALITELGSKKKKKASKKDMESKSPYPENQGMDTNKPSEIPSPEFPGTDNPSTEIPGTNNNILFNNNSNIINQSVYSDTKDKPKGKKKDKQTDKRSLNKIDQQDKDPIDEVNAIIDKAEIDIYYEPVKNMLIDCIQDMYLDSSIEKRIGIPHEIIKARLHRLNYAVIDRAIFKLKEASENGTEIKSPQSYFMKCLWTALTESPIEELQFESKCG